MGALKVWNQTTGQYEFVGGGSTGAQGPEGPIGPEGPEGPAGIPGSPTGSILAFAVATAPSGWLLCDGAAVSRATYSALFAVIGTTYGAGDGSTTFNVPNLKGRVLLGRNAEALNTTGGAGTHTHAGHGDHSHYVGGTTIGPEGVVVAQELAVIAVASSGHYHGVGIQSGGVSAGDVHDSPSNMPPYMTMPYIIKT